MYVFKVATIFSLLMYASAYAHEQTQAQTQEKAIAIQEESVSATSPSSFAPKAITPFTGKITRNRVRMRLAPTLDGAVIKELQGNDLVVVTGVLDDFYAVNPPKQTKGYIFRTYVLDGVVEGSHVNVRLEPDIAAPIVCQLNSGEKIAGKIAAQNSKWLEIALPASARFYVAKEFVTRIGDEHLLQAIETRKIASEEKLARLNTAVERELQKPFREIQLEEYTTELHALIADNKDLPKVTERAEGLLQEIQKKYLQKSIANKAEVTKTACVSDAGATSKEDSQQGSSSSHDTEDDTNANPPPPLSMHSISSMLPFQEREKSLLQDALTNKTAASEEQFYAQEEKVAVALSGIVRPYLRPIKNVPGDFILINPKTGVPVAFIYSTKLDLNSLVNKEVTIMAAERENNNFAYPAYFVIATK